MEEAGEIYFVDLQNIVAQEEEVDQQHLDYNRNVWSENATKFLISLYEINEKKFRNNKIKNDVVWKEISHELNKNGFNFSSKQSENKWKHLKKLYMRQVDNMGPKGTGEKPFKFKYFEEMDALFAKKPVVKPVAIASSSRGSQLDIDEILKDCDSLIENTNVRKREQSDENESEVPKNKIPKSSMALISYLKESNEAKELARQKRHEETLQIQSKALEVFASAINKLIEKI